jgi:hypothetical protein
MRAPRRRTGVAVVAATLAAVLVGTGSSMMPGAVTTSAAVQRETAEARTTTPEYPTFAHLPADQASRADASQE